MPVLIAMLHALPVLLVGVLFQSKELTVVAGVIMAVIGISSGSPDHAVLDLAAVLFGTYVTLQGIKGSSN